VIKDEQPLKNTKLVVALYNAASESLLKVGFIRLKDLDDTSL